MNLPIAQIYLVMGLSASAKFHEACTDDHWYSITVLTCTARPSFSWDFSTDCTFISSIKKPIFLLRLLITPGDLYRVSVVTSHPPISTAVISNLEGSVKFDNKEHLFHIYTKDKPNEIVWHLHMFYFRPTSDNCNITISNLNRNNGFLLDDIKVQVIETSPENEGGLAVTRKQNQM
jgi:hypothetical protein